MKVGDRLREVKIDDVDLRKINIIKPKPFHKTVYCVKNKSNKLTYFL